MAIETPKGDHEIKMNKEDLYKETLYTDRKSGNIRQLIPVDSNGENDDTREIIYVGEAQLMTPMGAMPLAFEIDASSIGEAAEKFSDNAKIAVEKAGRELQELRREAASSIVVPNNAGNNPGGIIGGK